MFRSRIGIVGVFIAFLAAAADEAPGRKPALSVSEIMLKAHQPGRALRKALDQRVIDGKASDAEKRRLVELYEALAQSRPPSGDQADWKKRTEKIVGAARDVAQGKDGARANLCRVLDCTGCHKSHPVEIE